MVSLNWNSLGIDVGKHAKLIDDITQHNTTIRSKLDNLAKVINQSRLEDTTGYLECLQEYDDLLEVITLYHDIGKVRDRLNHGEHSYDILQETSALQDLPLDEESRVLASLIIRHHLVLGTMLTGEWPVKKLRLVHADICSQVPEDVFYRLLVLFSVLDTWAYAHDDAYAARLLYNYDRIVQRFQQEPWTEHVQGNHLWRFCCFLAAWRHSDYLDEGRMEAYEEVLIQQTGHDRTSFWQRYRKLCDVNLNYAIWLLGNCCFDSIQLHREARLEDIKIYDSLFMILDDIVNSLAKVDTGNTWDVLFNGYRDPRIKAMRVFEKLRKEPASLAPVLEHKELNLSRRQLIYDFGLVNV